MTFSKSLAEYLAPLTGTEVVRLHLALGPPIHPGDPSPTGLYALVSTRKGSILRVSCVRGYAEEMADGESRVLLECRANVLPEKNPAERT